MSSPASTFVPKISEHWLRKNELRDALMAKLNDADFDVQDVVAGYFLRSGVLPQIFETKYQRQTCSQAIAKCVREGNEFLKDCLADWLRPGAPAEWESELLDSIKDLTDPDNPEYYLPDGTGFLGKFEAQQNPGPLPF